MEHIRKFNENLYKDDFEIGKKEVLILIDKLYEAYSDFINDVSPKNWRITGHHLAELHVMKEDIGRFSEITKEESEIDWVKDQRFK